MKEKGRCARRRPRRRSSPPSFLLVCFHWTCRGDRGGMGAEAQTGVSGARGIDGQAVSKGRPPVAAAAAATWNPVGVASLETATQRGQGQERRGSRRGGKPEGHCRSGTSAVPAHQSMRGARGRAAPNHFPAPAVARGGGGELAAGEDSKVGGAGRAGAGGAPSSTVDLPAGDVPMEGSGAGPTGPYATPPLSPSPPPAPLAMWPTGYPYPADTLSSKDADPHSYFLNVHVRLCIVEGGSVRCAPGGAQRGAAVLGDAARHNGSVGGDGVGGGCGEKAGVGASLQERQDFQSLKSRCSRAS